MMLAAKIALVALCALLVLVILLQSGRSAGLSGVITGGANQFSNRRPKGMDSLLARVTVVLAILLFLVTGLIAVMYHYNVH
ncbi:MULTISPECIES: preprotein translocase subunit SecG [Alicyclobacillus]|uniref:Protein-export membrane protein SecG n=3 Tax=Alicyclobacillus TaxID=29330 RepID=A0A1N7N442_9BACL|nr:MULTISPECIES: preprotein translocase subunit SecG [Alicyclobacillus]AEJ42675.1 preprotein translocase, SecG subunit [Alicyclobacillus acidocaldarius subsp. acidocaldarius Tc-4-1]MBF8378598.1 preprotein translocase subunit SecG [Alicyclobacillus mali (ex Roth et al. 2021)]MCL6488878.1 preprotein translocase subunit SecG [Alicyclobacillus mali (ex Roth et al. 2021)]SIS92931.1 protein translocase subunit secG [Alicyclobacillus vulcanalis]